MPLEYEPPVEKDPEPEPVVDDPKPDLDDLLAQEREKTAEGQRRIESQQVDYDVRMRQLENTMRQQFAEKTPPPQADSPAITMPTADDYTTPEGAAEATKKVAAAAVVQMAGHMDAKYNDALNKTRAEQFDTKREGLKTRKYYQYIEKDLNNAIERNPNIRYSPEALDILFTNLVGNATEEILLGEKEPDVPLEDPKPVQTSLAAPRARLAPATGPAPISTSPAPTLTNAEERTRNKFAPFIKNMGGGDYTPERYAKSRSERSGVEDIPTVEDTHG